MSGLAQAQSALLQALWQRSPSTGDHSNAWQARSDRGLQVYRANAQSLAVRALQAAYPVLAELLGKDNFEALAQAFWFAHPPLRGDIAQWGGDLALFIEHSQQLESEPYLPDVARAEWLLHTAATAPDAEPDPPSLALLMSSDPAELSLHLAPGTSVLPSIYPVASILCAHLDGTPSLEEAGALLRQGVAQSALIWRQGYKPCVRLAMANEAEFLHILLQAGSLAEALEAAPALDFSAWLPVAVRSGLLVAATVTQINAP